MGRMENRKRALIAIVVLMGGIAFVFKSQPPSGADEQVESTSIGSKSVEAESDTPSDRVSDRSQSGAAPMTLSSDLPPLPLPELPLSEQIQALSIRAMAGDPESACRLTIDLSRCAHYGRAKKFSDRIERSLSAQQGQLDPIMLERLAISRERESKLESYCAGITPDLSNKIDKLPRLAIDRLSARQKTVLALIQPDGNIRRLRPDMNVGSSEPADYYYPQILADNAVAFLEFGFEQRDPLALEGLVMLYAPKFGIAPPGVRVSLPNPRLYVKFSTLYERLYGPNALGSSATKLRDAILLGLPPDERAVIEAEVSAEERSWRVDPRSSSLGGKGPLIVGVTDPAANLCGSRPLGL